MDASGSIMGEPERWRSEGAGAVSLTIITATLVALGVSKPILWIVFALAVIGYIGAIRSHPWVARNLPPWVSAPILPKIPYVVAIYRRDAPTVSLPPPAELGYLDFERIVMEAIVAIGNSFESMNTEMEKQGHRLERFTARIVKSQNSGVEVRLRTMNASAKSVHKHAIRLGRCERSIREEVSAYSTNLPKWLEVLPEAALAVMKDVVIQGNAGMRESTKASLNGTNVYRESVSTIRDQRISREANIATDELIVVLERVTEDSNELLTLCKWVDEWGKRQEKSK